MAANEEDVLISLMNLQENIEREKYLREEIQKLRQETYEYWVAFRRHKDETADEYLELMGVRKAIMRQREEYVRECMNKEVIYVPNAAHLEAVIFLKREGWTGKALIYQQEFASELSKNNIQFILKLPMDSSETKNFMNELADDDHDYCSYALKLVFSGALPMVLNTVIKLNVFEIIAKAGLGAQLSPSQIVSQMKIPTSHENPDAPAMMLDRMLRMLASYSLFTSSVVGGHSSEGQRLYGLGPVSKYFVKNENNGSSFGPLLDLVQDKVVTHIWYELGPAILKGGTAFNRIYGMHLFKYAGLHQKFNEKFNTAMINHTKIVLPKILEYYRGFEHLKTLVDVGGGLGITLGLITSKYPNLKGINYDLPHVIENAPTYPGVKHIGGDMFESVPNGDAIFMKWILHDWDDGHCVKLLKNCYKALAENGKVIVVDAILPMNPDNSSSTTHTTQLDLFLLALFHPGGKERTEQELQALASQAGFAGITKMCVSCDLWVIEIHK